MYKQVIVVRKDLEWGKGKLAAHVAHAAVGSLMKTDSSIIEKWQDEGGMKIVVKVKDLKELKNIQAKIKNAGLPHFLVKDAGKTQLEHGTVTCLGIGPANKKFVDKITGKLKLL